MSFKRMNLILKNLPDKFSYAQLRKAIQEEAGLDSRTIEKYGKLMKEFNLIRETNMGMFEKVKK